MMIVAPRMIPASITPSTPPRISSAQRAFANRGCGLYQPCATSANAIDRGHEHRAEPDHVGVLPRELRPVVGQERAERLVQVGREQEREHDRADADHPADGALGEPEHEEAR